ncbi:MAG TPA: ABC transporter substrate-binding protein, partial [Acidimicrobiia bacterium]|nr:ABC transporter substrate-binding protein [Acidimicrobiia bacterium]
MMRRLTVVVACLALSAAACGNATTREERLAARGISAGQQAPGVGQDPEDSAAGGPSTAAESDAGGADASEVAAESSAAAMAGGQTSAGGPDRAAPGRPGSAASATDSRPSSTRSATAAPGAAVPDGRAAAGQTAGVPSPGGGGGAVPAGKKSEIVLGSFGVEAGPLGSIAALAPPAIRAWVADVNARGGLNGHPVRVIMADDGGDPARAQAIVRQMVEKDKVVAFFYPYVIGTLVPVLPYLEEKGIPVLGQMGAESYADTSTVVFQPFLNPLKGTAWGFLLSMSQQTEKKKVGIVWCREVVACKVVRDGMKSYVPYNGLDVVYDAQVTLAQPDYTAEVLRAQQAGVEILAILADNATVNRVAQSAHRQNFRPVLASTHNIQDSSSVAFAGELDGLITYSRVPPYTSPKFADYVRAMNTYQPKAAMGEIGAAGWAMGKLVEARVAPLLDADPSPAEIMESMYSIRNEALGGLLPGVTFPRQKDRTEVNLCVVPVAFKDK